MSGMRSEMRRESGCGKCFIFNSDFGLRFFQKCLSEEKSAMVLCQHSPQPPSHHITNLHFLLWSLRIYLVNEYYLIHFCCPLSFSPSDLLWKPGNSTECPDPDPRWPNVFQIHYLRLQGGLLLYWPAYPTLHC